MSERIRVNPNGTVTIYPVNSKAEIELIDGAAEKAGCEVHWHEWMTRAIITGTKGQLATFRNLFPI